MQTQDAYNAWASTYDDVINRTRDLEEQAIKAVLGDTAFEKILEIGCGTGKNTLWLAQKCHRLQAIDFSCEMLQIAKQKISAEKVQFFQADITKTWNFEKVNLITCSLVLEHIQDISFIFQQAFAALEKGGQFYICELHPYKQMQGSRARFELDGDILHLEYFIHHVSDYLTTAAQNGFVCENLQEWFDNGDRTLNPRLISFSFRKNIA